MERFHHKHWDSMLNMPFWQFEHAIKRANEHTEAENKRQKEQQKEQQAAMPNHKPPSFKPPSFKTPKF
jgi:hypothetical protein